MRPQSAGPLERKISLARLFLGTERLWEALLWPVLMLGAVASLVISGLLPELPATLRYVLFAVFLAGFAYALRPAFGVNWPSRADAIRRVERTSGLAHRPVATIDDRLSEEEPDGRTAAIWQEHKLRQLRQLAHLRAGRPLSFWRDLDPRAFRVPVTLALLVSLVLGQGNPRANLTDSLRAGLGASSVSVAVDAWLKPPAYTGKAPVMLTSPATIERLKIDPEIVVPENSVLVLRATGAAKPALSFYELIDGADAGPVAGLTPSETATGKLYQSETKLTRPVLARLMAGGSELASWRISLIPDQPPAIAVTRLPQADASGALTVPWKTSDDYGVSGIIADISLSDNQDDGVGFASNGVFLFEPPKLPVTLRRANPKSEEGQSTANLTAHPWAGLRVDLTLEARDAAGHVTTSAVQTFRLPERIFLKPLARALIEQRKRLIFDPEQASDVAKLLEALLAYPKGLIETSGIHIAIATVMSRLANAESTDDVGTAIDDLWQIAVMIEDGALADARAELEALRQQLERALAEGAPPEKIQELMGKLRQAMDRYVQSLMAETMKRMQQQGDRQRTPQQGQMVSPQDLQKMLDMIEKLSKSGANDAARQMLSELDRILRNLQPGGTQAQRGQQDGSPMAQMLDQLSDLLRKQQGLMDDTQRMPEEGESLPQDPNGSQQEGLSPDELGNRQQGLAGQLQQLLDQLGQQGLQGPSSLGEAGREMKEAEGSLRQGNRGEALGSEGDAIAKLREGAKGLVQEMIRQGQGQQGAQGERGEARGDDRDPLGRPMPNRSEDYGPERNMLPSEMAIRRAQEILDALRSRANIPELPRFERDYIDRLLRGLY